MHRLSAGTAASTKREVGARISAARRTAPAERVPSLASTPLVKWYMAGINYGKNGAF